MKGKAIIPLILGLCLGFGAVKLGIDAIRRAQASDADRRTYTVIRASEDIGALQEIAAGMLEAVKTEASALLPEAECFASVEDVVGRVSAKAIPRHVPILKSMLAPPGTRSGMVGRIPPGYRAVSVRIDEVTGVAYQISPGDWVDVIVVMDIRRGGARRGETIAEVILQRVQVAAIGRSTAGMQSKEGGRGRPAKSATLLVVEEDVPKLHLAGTRGRLTLAMRGDDTRTTEIGAVAGSDVFASERRNRPAPAVAVPVAATSEPPDEGSAHAVTIYHGGSKTRYECFTFENRRSRNLLALTIGPTTRVATMMTRPGKSPSSREGALDNAATAQPDDVDPSDIDEETKIEDDKEIG